VSDARRLPLSLAAWSLHREFEEGKIDQIGMVRLAGELGFSGFELLNEFFPSPTALYLARLRGAADEAGVSLLLIMCDDEGDLTADDRRERLQAARNHRKWIDVAASLGCAAIRVNLATDRTPDEAEAARDHAAEALADLLAYAGSEVSVLVENHGGLSSDPDWVVSLVETVGEAGFGTLPDFGNFPESVGDRYAALARLMPRAGAVSAKCYDFGPDGRETTIDFARAMNVVRGAGYSGHIGVEYEGERLSERDGILAAKALLERS
jgi:sugar phosphate isomerase/epimerase